MIDFTNCVEEINTYKGSEKMKTLIYEGEKYLVKFPNPVREKNKEISYINNAYSEYIGSKIFEIVGIPCQKVLLGKFNYNQKEKNVCACLDFADEDNFLLEFKNLAVDSYSCLKENSKKINSLSYIKEMQNEECNKALKRIFKNIKINNILGFIDSIESLSKVRCDFYKYILEFRYYILEETYKKMVGD